METRSAATEARVAVVTGGAKGIGRATVEATRDYLAQGGTDVEQ